MSTIAFPTLSRSAPPAITLGLRSYTQRMESPLTGSVQTAEIAFSARWYMRMSWPNLEETTDAPLLQSFKLQLRGGANRAALYNFARPVPQGTITTSGVTVNGAVAQGATSVTFAGCGASKTLKVGDFFAVAGELKMVSGTAAFTSTGGGAMSGVTFEPPVRTAAGWANGAAVTLTRPTALFIQNDDNGEWDTRAPQFTEIAMDMVEVFA
jgi:hypothetical protein